jgi:predicted ester cyclase
VVNRQRRGAIRTDFVDDAAGSAESAERDLGARASETKGGRTLSVEENKALLRHALDTLWNRRDISAWLALTAPTIAVHLGNAHYHGPDDVRGFFEKLQTAFTDSRVTIEDIWGEDGRVAVRWRIDAKQTGALEHVEPLGTDISIWAVEAARVEGGTVAEVWIGLDRMSTMEQLGVLPTDGSLPPRPIQWMLAKQRRKRLQERCDLHV